MAKSVQAVNARELHVGLGVGKDFSNWIKEQIRRAMLVDGVDYTINAEKGEQTGRGGHNRLNYLISLDAAKNICMMSQYSIRSQGVWSFGI